MRLHLPPIRTGTSGTYDGGRGEWLRDDHILRDVNQIMKTVEFHKSSADPESLKVREMTSSNQKTLERHLGNHGVSAGRMLVPDHH